MSSDPHPLPGWARYLERQRRLSKDLNEGQRRRLLDAVHRAEVVYKQWRPELRYKLTEVKESQLAEVRLAAEWFIQNIGRL